MQTALAQCPLPMLLCVQCCASHGIRSARGCMCWLAADSPTAGAACYRPHSGRFEGQRTQGAAGWDAAGGALMHMLFDWVRASQINVRPLDLCADYAVRS